MRSDRSEAGEHVEDPEQKPLRRNIFAALGPGLISGAANDDPTAIATYSQAGAKFGYELTWLPFCCLPMMAVVQEISGRFGRTTGRGIAGNMRRHYPAWLLRLCVVLLCLANTVAIGADLGAMAETVRLLVGGPQLLYVVLFAGFCVLTQVFMRYPRYVTILKWATLSLLAYFGAALMANLSWSEILEGLRPHFALNRDWITTVVAIFGVALSPYIYFWQSAQEADEQRVQPEREPLVCAPQQAPAAITRIRLDTWIGMAVAASVGLAIMITTAATLHVAGTTAIQTSAQAAEALRPVAGPFAFALFSAGIIGTGLLAIPVLAGSAAFAVGEALRWPVGVARQPREAKAFYAAIAVAAGIGVAFNLFEFEPMWALYWAAVLNGIIAVPILAVMMAMASRRRIMGEFTIGWPLRIVGWGAVGVAAACVTAMAWLSIGMQT